MQAHDGRPLCSVIIPTYNCAPYLLPAIRSVFMQLHVDRELIIVDDGSTDGTAAAIGPWRGTIDYIRQRNQGVSAARNAGLARARGEYVAFLDADDAWHPAKLALQLSVFDACPDAVAVCTDFGLADERGVILEERFITRRYRVFSAYNLHWRDIFPHHLQLPPPPRTKMGPAPLDVYHGDAFEALFLGNFILTSSMVLRRTVVEQVGGFTVGRRTQEDYEYWLKVALAGPIAYLDAPLLFYRRRPFQLTAPSESGTNSEDKLKVIEGIADTARRRLGDRLVARRLADHHRAQAVAAFNARSPVRARHALWKSHAHRAFDIRTTGLYLLSLLPDGIGRLVRRVYRSLGRRRHGRAA